MKNDAGLTRLELATSCVTGIRNGLKEDNLRVFLLILWEVLVWRDVVWYESVLR